MSSTRETILSMSSIIIRQRHPIGAVNRDEIAAAVRDCAGLISATLNGEQVDAIVAELETRLVVTVGRPTALSDEQGHVPWYFGKRKEGRRFFRRYADFLLQDQQWPPASIEAIDIATDLVMEQIEDPEREGRWDRRGLVVGHVQSGKTANYAGLANKAADAGYKLIVVLAGMHNVLTSADAAAARSGCAWVRHLVCSCWTRIHSHRSRAVRRECSRRTFDYAGRERRFQSCIRRQSGHGGPAATCHAGCEEKR